MAHLITFHCLLSYDLLKAMNMGTKIVRLCLDQMLALKITEIVDSFETKMKKESQQ